MDVDTNKLRRMVKNFEFYSTPSDGCHSNPATVGDIHKVVDNTAKVLYEFIREIERSQG